ncbi:MAG: hypothetical protein ChlgKO_01240 [Chlamydiales bacterium]
MALFAAGGETSESSSESNWTPRNSAYWAYRKLVFGDDWEPPINTEKDIALMTVDELHRKIEQLKVRENSMNENIELLERTIGDLRDTKTMTVDDYEKTRIEYETKKGVVEGKKSELESKRIELQRQIDNVDRQKNVNDEMRSELIHEMNELENRIRHNNLETERIQTEFNITKAVYEENMTSIKKVYEEFKSLYEKKLVVLKERTEKYVPVNECDTAFQKFSFFSYDPLPVAGWVASLGVRSFYESRLRSLFRDHQSFIDINSMDHFEVWLEPFGTKAKWGQEDISCELDAFGFSLGMGGTLAESFSLGLGFGFWRSNISGDHSSGSFDAVVDTFVLGPYFSWSFGKGFLGLMFWGGYCDSVLDRKGELNGIKQLTQNEHDGWNLSGRAELGYSFEVGKIKANPAFFTPFVSVDIYGDFQGEYTEFNGGKKIYEVEDRNCTFLSFVAAAECKKEFHSLGKGFAIPSLTLGWRYLHPLYCDDSMVKCYIPPDSNAGEEVVAELGGKSHGVSHESYVSNGLVFAEGGFTYIARNGIATALKLEASVGSKYQIYGAQLRLEIGW